MFILPIDCILSLESLKEQILRSITIRLRTLKKSNLSIFSKSKCCFLSEKARELSKMDKFDLPFELLSEKVNNKVDFKED